MKYNNDGYENDILIALIVFIVAMISWNIPALLGLFQ